MRVRARSKKSSKSSVKVQDLSPSGNPKGGYDPVKTGQSPTIRLADGSVVPNPALLNFNKAPR